MSPAETAPDFQVENHGSVILLRPGNEAAKDWLDFNCVPEPWQWFGSALAVEPRCAPDIIEGLQEEGFTIE